MAHFTRDIDDDVRRDATAQHPAFQPLHPCQCGSDLPGTCPGPQWCPYSDYAEPEEDEGSYEDRYERSGEL